MEAALRTARCVHTPRVGAQLCPRRVLMALVPQTIDLDIVNCMFTLVHQLLARHEFAELPDEVRDTIRRCAEEREQL